MLTSEIDHAEPAFPILPAPPKESLTAAPEAPPQTPGQADLDPSNDYVVAPPDPVPDCGARLEAAGVRFTPSELPLRRGDRDTVTCGSEQVVIYRGRAKGIRYSTPPMLTCTLALALARFEAIVQEEAEAHFHARVVRIEHAGTYNCRKMARFTNMVSEHSYANAIDIRSMKLASGREASVIRHFGSTGAEPTSVEGKFLRRVARRAFDEGVFSVVLTPFFDALHRDHFHLDMAHYRVDGTR